MLAVTPQNFFGELPTTSDVRSPTSTATEVRSPTSTATEVRSPTSTSTEVRSPTSTSTEVRSPTSTSTDAYTQGNVTVTGGAGAGSTTVNIYGAHPDQPQRADEQAHMLRSEGAAWRMPEMMYATGAPRPMPLMPEIMAATSADRPFSPIPGMMHLVDASRAPAPIPGMMHAANGTEPSPGMTVTPVDTSFEQAPTSELHGTFLSKWGWWVAGGALAALVLGRIRFRRRNQRKRRS